MKQGMRWLAVAGVLTLVAAACSNNDNSGGGSSGRRWLHRSDGDRHDRDRGGRS